MNYIDGASKTFLGIIDGQFYPIEEFELHQKADKKKIVAGPRLQCQDITTGSIVELSFMTRRKPEIRLNNCPVYIRTSDKIIKITDITITSMGISTPNNHDMFEVGLSGSTATETLLYQ